MFSSPIYIFKCQSDLILDVGGVVSCNSNTGITQPSALWKPAVPPPPDSILSLSLSPALSLSPVARLISRGTFHLGLTENRLFTAPPKAVLLQERKPHFVCAPWCALPHTQPHKCTYNAETHNVGSFSIL